MNKKHSTIPGMPAPPSRGSQIPPKNLHTIPPAKPITHRRVVWSSPTKYSGTNISQEVINIK